MVFWTISAWSRLDLVCNHILFAKISCRCSWNGNTWNWTLCINAIRTNVGEFNSVWLYIWFFGQSRIPNPHTGAEIVCIPQYVYTQSSLLSTTLMITAIITDHLSHLSCRCHFENVSMFLRSYIIRCIFFCYHLANLSGVCMLLASYAGYNRGAVLACFILAETCLAFYYTSLKVNSLDLTPNYAGYNFQLFAQNFLNITLCFM